MKFHFSDIIAILTTRLYHYWTKVVSAWRGQHPKNIEDRIQEYRGLAELSAKANDEDRVFLWNGKAKVAEKERDDYARNNLPVLDAVGHAPLGVTGQR